MLLKEILDLIPGWDHFHGEEEEKELMYIYKLKRGDIPYLVLTIIFSIVFIGLVSRNTIYFSPIEEYSVEDLPDLLSRIRFVCKHKLFPILVLFPCMCCFIVCIKISLATDPWEHHDYWIRKMNNLLIISNIQFLISFGIQLILVLMIDAELTLKYVPAIHFLYNLGRTTIWLGPILYCKLGLTLTITPTLFTFIYIVGV